MKTTLSDLVFIDVETTGLNDQVHRVIEVAATRVPFDPSQWDKPFSKVCLRFMPNAEDLTKAEPSAFKVNGFTVDHPDWAGAPIIDTVQAKEEWKKLLPLLRKATVVSQNVPFDRGFIWEELKRCNLLYNHAVYGLLPPWERRFIDIQSYSFFIALVEKLPKWGLHDVYETLGLPKLTSHRAEADIERGMAVMKRIWDSFIADYT